MEKKKRNNRTAGHKFETDIAEELRGLGFEYAVTSRSENRSRDNAKIDIVNRNEFRNGRIPYNFQLKSVTDYPHTSGKAEKIHYKKLLNEIELEEGLINVVLHRHTVRKPGGTKFMVQGEYAFLHKRDFFSLIQDLLNCKKKLKEHDISID